MLVLMAVNIIRMRTQQNNEEASDDEGRDVGDDGYGA
jgi:hypothetical protein